MIINPPNGLILTAAKLPNRKLAIFAGIRKHTVNKHKK